MTTLNKIVAIWGAAIILYLFLANRQGTSSGFSAVQNLVTGTTRTLQGR